MIIDENPGEINMFNWGLIPFWAKNDMIKKATLNVKIETVTEKPAFRNSIGKRCLTVASGYYEWQWLDPKGKIVPKDLNAIYNHPMKLSEFYNYGKIKSFPYTPNPENKDSFKISVVLKDDKGELLPEDLKEKICQKDNLVFIHPDSME